MQKMFQLYWSLLSKLSIHFQRNIRNQKEEKFCQVVIKNIIHIVLANNITVFHSGKYIFSRQLRSSVSNIFKFPKQKVKFLEVQNKMSNWRKTKIKKKIIANICVSITATKKKTDHSQQIYTVFNINKTHNLRVYINEDLNLFYEEFETVDGHKIRT